MSGSEARNPFIQTEVTTNTNINRKNSINMDHFYSSKSSTKNIKATNFNEKLELR